MVGSRQTFQPGVLVRRENREGLAGLGEDFVAVENRLVLAVDERNTACLQAFGNGRIARLARRFVIAVGEDGGHAKLDGKRRNFVARPAVPNDQAATAGTQGGIEFDQRFANEMNAPVLAGGQRIKDVGIENEGAVNVAGIAQGRTEGGVVVVAQVAAEPDQGFFVVHGWFVPPRRLKFHLWTTST
ncbi:hypothetical protein SDC9_95097 [bioreactor metagenome]|uniref:Uncharacterized protein n=1 Tax=bioreactor metagenome TaxID=1076179 RepID=A0A645ABY0_9ZZZZ